MAKKLKRGASRPKSAPRRAKSVMAESVHEIAMIAAEIADRADIQKPALLRTTSRASDMAASLKETAEQTESLTSSSQEMSSSVNEIAASIEQVTANTNQIATAATQ